MSDNELSSGPSPDPHRPSSPLRHRVFRAIWIAAICSYVGNWLQDVGEAWTMMSLTSNAALVALVTTSNTIPTFILMLPAGVLSDRWNRRTILLWAQSALVMVAAVLAVLTWSRWLTPAVILAASAGLGIGSAITTPAWQTLVPELVPRKEIPEAVTLNSVAFNIARSVGPALGGFVLSLAGPATVFALNALSFVAVIEVLRRYPEVKEAAAQRRPGGIHQRHEPFLRAMVTAISYAARTRSLRALYAATACFAFAGASVPALLPVFAKDSLHTSARGYGVLLGALGAGGVTGAIVLRRVRPMLRARTLVAIGMIVYGVESAAMSLAPSLPLAVLCYFPAGMGWIATFTTINSLVQLTSPRWVKSRAMALYQLAFYSMWSLGATLGGVAATSLGAALTIRVAAIGAVLAGGIATMLPFPTYEDDAERFEEAATSMPAQ